MDSGASAAAKTWREVDPVRWQEPKVVMLLAACLKPINVAEEKGDAFESFSLPLRVRAYTYLLLLPFQELVATVWILIRVITEKIPIGKHS